MYSVCLSGSLLDICLGVLSYTHWPASPPTPPTLSVPLCTHPSLSSSPWVSSFSLPVPLSPNCINSSPLFFLTASCYHQFPPVHVSPPFVQSMFPFPHLHCCPHPFQMKMLVMSMALRLEEIEVGLQEGCEGPWRDGHRLRCVGGYFDWLI